MNNPAPTLDLDQAMGWIHEEHGRTGGYVSVCAINPTLWGSPPSIAVDLTDGGADQVAAFLVEYDRRGAHGLYVRQTSLTHRPDGGRGTAEDSLSLPGLWMDGDIAGPGHKHVACLGGAACYHPQKDGPAFGVEGFKALHRKVRYPLPADRDAMWAVAVEAGFDLPTVFHHSGGGLNGYWLLDEPRPVTDGDRGPEAQLSARLHDELKHAAARLGLHYGPLGDMARVMRLPGTWNRKPGMPGGAVLCATVEGGTGRRFSWDELTAMVERAEARTAAAVQSLSRGQGAPMAVPAAPPAPDRPRITQVNSPIDDFNARADWMADVLSPAGWSEHSRPGAQIWVTRPGKDPADGQSAVINGTGTGLLRMFSSDDPVFEQGEFYTKAGAWRELHHGGADGDPSWSATNRDLRQRGYGDPLPAREWLPPEPVAPDPDTLTPPEGSVWDGADPQDTGAGLTDEEQEAARLALAAQERAEKIRAKAEDERIRREARRLVDAEEARNAFRPPVEYGTLADELAMPEEEVAYRIDQVMPAGANTVLTAQFKTGKTTLVNNMVKSLADGKPFLGRYPVQQLDGRIGLFNYEVGAAQYRRWLRDTDIEHPERVALLHLRGMRLPLTSMEDWVVDWLKRHEVEVWILDPFARAMVGSGDESDNTEVGVFTDTIDVIKERAGVRELIMPAHTGRAEQEIGKERARGASRLDDWADVRWILTKDDDGNRFLRCSGRDVEEPEQRLRYRHEDRSLIGEAGVDRAGARRGGFMLSVVECVRLNPGSGVNDVVRLVQGRKGEVGGVLKQAVENGLLRVESGPNNSRRHYVVPGAEPRPEPPNRQEPPWGVRDPTAGIF